MPGLTDPDVINKRSGKTLYEASTWEIIWRNFLAGMSRGFGNLILFIIFFLILGNLFATYVWPYMQPVVENFYSANHLIDVMGQLTNGQFQQ